MKNYIKIVGISVLLFGIAVLVFVLIANGTDMGPADVSRENIILLNRIAKTAEEHKGDIDILDEDVYDADFAIIDTSDNLLYSHTNGRFNADDLSVGEAVQKRYPYVYLSDKSGVWGTVILFDDGMTGMKELRCRFYIAVFVFCLIVLTGMVVYGIYIHKNIIVPFANMRAFAAKVAQGKLDEPLGMDKGNMFGAFTESFDIMREELAESRQRELALQKKERELVASLSHDLKTPVTGIKLAAELIQMRLSVKADSGSTLESHNGEPGDYVFSAEEMRLLNTDADGIRGKAEQINALLGDLFTSALDDLGEFKVNCRDEESGVLGDIVRNFDDRRLAVLENIPAVIINIDTKRMSQVIGNIISNSYKYADTRIDIRFRVSEHYLEMQIRDCGPGVPPEEIDLITNKFYRGKEWENTDKDGHGLGLYISKTLMKMMNGDLIAESDGKGLAVTLIIPLS